MIHAPRVAASVSLAVAWVFDNLDRFSPFDYHDVYRAKRSKQFIELGIMFAVYAAVTGDTSSPAVRRAAGLFEAAGRRADFTDWALRFPADIVNYAELCAAVDALGGDATELRHRLQYAVDAGVLSHVERLPHRLLELRAALDWARIGHSLPSMDDILTQSILGRDLLTPLLSDTEIYAITHIILFGTRFGLARNAMPGRLHSTPVRSLLCDLLVVTAHTQKWDLLGELLLCWDGIGFEHDLVTTAAWASFLGAFRADGAVLPWAEQAKSEPIACSGAADAADFNHVYHTTLVAILAGTVLLNRPGVGRVASLSSKAAGC